MPRESPSHPRSIVVHGHFYQPPREDPWLDDVPRQPSAAPYRDWNERIERECYGPMTHARFSGPTGEVAVNVLEYLSFNFGPTLLTWLKRHAPRTYLRILEADARSLDRLGHGNAIAQAYHHTILPLAPLRDKITEVRWGVADFERRFSRKPEGLWLPEAAVDAETLDVVADAGVGFVILAPHQIDPLPAQGMPGRYTTGGGARLALVPYDGGLSHDVAFGNAARDGERWAERLATAGADDRRLLVVATDGETYGHHHEFAEMGLAAALHHLGTRDDVVVENPGSFLARHPPSVDVEIVAPSSWSCAHGVERWRSDCGCRLEAGSGTQQAWRGPLREGLENLAAELHGIFEAQAGRWLKDPWQARNSYGWALPERGGGADFAARSGAAFPPALDRALAPWLKRPAATLDAGERTRLVELLEMERDALRMFTSCGWFFDDVDRLEPRQILAYAAHAIELSGEADRLRTGFVEHLERALSNDLDVGSAADVFQGVLDASQARRSGRAPG